MDINLQIIIIISSPSGAGKTSICKKLLENDKSLSISISDTTRIQEIMKLMVKTIILLMKLNLKK